MSGSRTLIEEQAIEVRMIVVVGDEGSVEQTSRERAEVNEQVEISYVEAF